MAPTLQLQWPQEAMRARKRAIGSAQPLKCDEEDPPAGRDEEQAMGYPPSEKSLGRLATRRAAQWFSGTDIV